MIKSLAKDTVRNGLSNKGLVWTWGYLVPLIVLAVVIYRVFNVSEMDGSSFFPTNQPHLLLFALVLLPLNVWLESSKWYVIVRKYSRLSITQCVKVVLAGKSLNIISPLGLGDAMIKYLHVEKNKKTQSYALILIDRLSSMAPTMIFGVISTAFLLNQGLGHLVDILYFIGGGVFLLGVILILFSKYFFRIKVKYIKYVDALLSLGVFEVLSLVGLSALRYLVFSLQFYLIMNWVGVSLSPTVLLLGIFWIFFVKTMIPDFTIIGDLVKRELSAITFFTLFLPSMELIIVANIWIWLMNIILPSLAGLFFVSDLKRQFA